MEVSDGVRAVGEAEHDHGGVRADLGAGEPVGVLVVRTLHSHCGCGGGGARCVLPWRPAAVALRDRHVHPGDRARGSTHA